jgi:peptide methionine sulfoxide reductase MsrA
MTIQTRCGVICILFECIVLNFTTASNLSIYFGNGCFWGRQHDFVKLEMDRFGRHESEITSIAGYAGGRVNGGKACYYNVKNDSVYSYLGDAEVVMVSVPEEHVSLAFRHYFESFIKLPNGAWGREDYFDEGSAYRAIVGLPGGFDNMNIVQALHEANLHNMTVARGLGSDPDTLGTNTIYVMDSTHFPYTQAELCEQFHNNVTSQYSPEYHALLPVLVSTGRLKPTTCPTCRNQTEL